MEVDREFTLLTEELQDTKVVRSFCNLLDHSKQLFNGLRDLPQHGQRQWQPHFAKTFEVFTKLWKFQQDNREVLDRCYNLKRWQIGEIASKIGQLYYHYYLRTSETNYLNEAYQFYTAIRVRNYYRTIDSEKNPELLPKKYRYYARYIVVCLLLNYRQDVVNLIKDLSRQVGETVIEVDDSGDTDWELVVKEIENFPDVDPVEVLNSTTYQRCSISSRMLPTSLPHCDSGFKTVLSLGDVILVGNSPSQLKFSEITIDMLRMIHVLERASGGGRHITKPRPSQEKSLSGAKRENPHKYLLYRPTIFDLLTCLSTAVKELPLSEALLFYVSAQGKVQKTIKKSDSSAKETTFYKVVRSYVSDSLYSGISVLAYSARIKNSSQLFERITLVHDIALGYDGEGVITNGSASGEDKNGNDVSQKATFLNDIHCLHPADIYPCLRKPMLIIIDSDNASAFSALPDLFGQPLVCLMSPNHLPTSNKKEYQDGRLMTSFLYSPLMGFMLVCGIGRISDQVYAACSDILARVMLELQKLFLRSKTVNYNYLLFFGDEFCRLILLRFAFFFYTLRLHKSYKEDKFHPCCLPILPDDFFNSISVIRTITDISDLLGVRGLFAD